MIFDPEITFEPGTRRAVLWAETIVGARFQVTIDPRYAIELWGLRPLEAANFADCIREHMDEVLKAATAAYANGELRQQLD